MTILAVCGPIGSDFKTFSQECYSLLNKDKTLLIDSSDFKSSNSLLAAIENVKGDIIIFGADIFLDEQLRSKLDIKVFLELDADLCLSNYLKSIDTNTKNVEEHIEFYSTQIKPLNEKIRLSAKYAALRRPQESSNHILINLLINEDDKTLKKSGLPAVTRDMFWKTESQEQQIDKTMSNILSNTVSN
ncbi:uridine kinase [Legionella sp. PC997]|uniref:uridine kinase n=1 Tax=Legionella sp. PC997 TaxID=2755562 RepID=UPI0015F996EA|nr:uridine kinase [Legionella sp. PC997]QMT59401.1 Uridine kinase [Legionella sp. PC997]